MNSTDSDNDVNNLDKSSSNLIILILFYINLIQQIFIQLPVSILNIWLQFHTSLIHPNLKCILLTQSASFCLYGYARSANAIFIHIYGVEHWMGGQYIIQVNYQLIHIYGNYPIVFAWLNLEISSSR